jgi:hypothetical protein
MMRDLEIGEETIRKLFEGGEGAFEDGKLGRIVDGRKRKETEIFVK